MNWFLTKIAFQIICGDGNHNAQFDEQLRLVAARTKVEAFYKAQQLGVQEEETFYNQKKQMVQWKFINVMEVYRLGEMIDGAEMYSRIEERDNGDAYIHIINKKADVILNSDSSELLQLV